VSGTGVPPCCHCYVCRCGNLRKRNVKCVNCPHIFCQRCAEKEVLEYGADIFGGGCPVCKYLCCCNDPRDAQFCPRLFHCYKSECACRTPLAYEHEVPGSLEPRLGCARVVRVCVCVCAEVSTPHSRLATCACSRLASTRDAALLCDDVCALAECPATKNSGGTGSGDAMNANTDRQPQTDVAEAARVVSALIEGPPASRPPTLRHLIGSQPLPQVGATSRTPPGAASSMGSGGRGGGRGGASAHSHEDRESAPGFVPPPANAVARRALGGEGGSSAGGGRGFSPSSAASGAGGGGTAFESPTARGTPRSATNSALALLAGSALTDGHGKASPRGLSAGGGRAGGGRGATAGGGGAGKRYGTRGVSLDFHGMEGAGEEGEGEAAEGRHRYYGAEGEEGGGYGGAGEEAGAGDSAGYGAAGSARAGGHAGEGEAEGAFEHEGAGGGPRSRRGLLRGRASGGAEAAEGSAHGRQARHRDRRGSSLARKVTGVGAAPHSHAAQGPQASELMLGPDAAMSTRGGSGLLPLDSVPRASPVAEGSGDLLAGARLQMPGLPGIKGSAVPVLGLLASPSPPGSAYLSHLRPADAASAMAGTCFRPQCGADWGTVR